jgi:hypothetical protein
MAASPLKKATRNGFTVLPNKIIDEILQSSGKHVADTLALLIYCVRHIPAQNGTLSLQGNFSQGQICADLGWGPTNKQRLKRACQHLETVGVIDQELRDNNVVLLHIKAELTNEIPEAMTESRGESKNSDPVAKNPYNQGVKIPSVPYIENKYINNSQKNLLATSPRRNQETVTNHHTSDEKDDDVEKLCSLYRDLLRKPITPKHREIFSRTYRENARPYALVETAIKTISEHPKLHKDTVSINAVWQLPFMLRASRQFETNVRDLLHNLNQSQCPDIEHRIIKAANESGVDLEIFKAYFAKEISEASAKNKVPEQNSNLSSLDMPKEISPIETARDALPKRESPAICPFPVSEKIKVDRKDDDLMPFTEAAKKKSYLESIPNTCLINEPPKRYPYEGTEPKVLTIHAIDKRTNFDFTRFESDSNNPGLVAANQLVKAATKVEFLSLIKATLELPTLETRDKEIFTSLVDLTLLPNSTLCMLQMSVAQRFRLKKAS